MAQGLFFLLVSWTQPNSVHMCPLALTRLCEQRQVRRRFSVFPRFFSESVKRTQFENVESNVVSLSECIKCLVSSWLLEAMRGLVASGLNFFVVLGSYACFGERSSELILLSSFCRRFRASINVL